MTKISDIELTIYMYRMFLTMLNYSQYFYPFVMLLFQLHLIQELFDILDFLDVDIPDIRISIFVNFYNSHEEHCYV